MCCVFSRNPFYPVLSIGHVQNFKLMTLDKDVLRMNGNCALLCGLSGSHAVSLFIVRWHPVSIMYVYVDVVYPEL